MVKVYPLKPDKSGLSRLYIIYRTIQIPVKVKIPKRSWDHNKQIVKTSFVEHKRANAQLTKKKAEVVKAIEFFELNEIQWSKKEFLAYLKNNNTIIIKPQGSYTVSDLLRKYAIDHKHTKKPGYLRKYRTIANNLDEYNPGLMAAKFDTRQWNRLVDHLIEDKELENNTIHDYARKIRLSMQTYLAQGVSVHPDYSKIKYKYVDPKPFWLDWEKIELLEKFEPLDGDEVYLQDFLFRCYTGLRWSDAHQLKEENIIKKGKDVYLDFTVIKTRLDQNLLLSSKAVGILKKWKWSVPRLYTSHCNERIKLICKAAFKDHPKMVQKVRFSGSERKVKLIPEWKMVTTHVARRTFGRRWMDLGGDIAKLSMYYGHSSIEQTTKYIGYHTKEVNDELRKLMG